MRKIDFDNINTCNRQDGKHFNNFTCFRHFILLFLVLAIVVCGGYCGYRLICHERQQSKLITDLTSQVSFLSEQLEDDTKSTEFKSRVGEGYDYLAIGNSITFHDLADYWWGEWGMAASEKSHDYYHIITKSLSEKYGEINTAVYNYAIWETQSHDRSETWELIDKYLVDGVDLVTVQLSENCSDLTTFKSDFKGLLQHIVEKCEKDVQIIVIDDFWDDGKSEMKKSVCEDTIGTDRSDKQNISFVDLSDIRGKSEYQVGMGTIVSGEDGAKHTIEHSGVAVHPGDKGMKYIADEIIKIVNKKDQNAKK